MSAKSLSTAGTFEDSVGLEIRWGHPGGGRHPESRMMANKGILKRKIEHLGLEARKQRKHGI